ncbi:hypothetical protein JL720_2966 [Aureococcus anophagefferens]|nr:hypothetical protein JL720_2966 [Aureococcus anophagefferens]
MEQVWRMPMPPAYEKDIESTIADLKNVGSRARGAITAALFLGHFVEDTPHAHVDIAGPVWNGKAGEATGFGVKTMAHFFRRDRPASKLSGSTMAPIIAEAVMYEEVDQTDAPPADVAGVELAPVGAVFEVRVLDVKDQGAVHVVRVPEGGSVDDLMGAVAAAVAGAPVSRQRLIAGGRQLRREALATTASRGQRAPTVHLMVRPEDAGALPEARPVDAEVANPLHENLAAVVAAAAREHRDGGAARSTARSTAWALLDATADPNLVDDDAAGRSDVALSTTELALNVAGVWVGAAGLRASQRLDPTSVDAYDRSLRLLAMATLSYEAYHSLVVLPNTLPERFQRARDAADAEAAETLEPPDANATAVERRDDDDDDDPAAGDGGAAEASLSRESLILSGFVTVMLWASIWLVCVNNAARLRLAVREHRVAALTVADLHAAANRDAFFP